MTSPLVSVFTAATTERLAGQRAYWNAQLIRAESIENVQEFPDRVVATIRGTLPYRTELWVNEKDKPKFSCSCPQGDEGKFCKHCVALALYLLKRHDLPTSDPLFGLSTRDAVAEISDDIASLSHDVLVELVRDAATRDGVTALRLAGHLAGDGEHVAFDAKVWRARITAVFGPKSRFIDYRAANNWAQRILALMDELKAYLSLGVAEDLVALFEYAHTRTDRAVQHVDDSDGWITTIDAEVSNAHLEACRHARPPAKALARRLAKFELNDELDTFRGAAERYADVLGDEGIAEYQRVIDEAATLADPHSSDPWSSRKYRLRGAREGIAKATGNVDELISLLASSRTLPDEYLTIVNALVKESRTDEALAWGDRGLNSDVSSEHYRRELRDRMAELHAARGDLDKVRSIRLEGFRASPSPEAFRQYLAVCADDRRPKERADLFTWLVDRAKKSPGRQTADDLVRNVLAEGDVFDAFQAAEHYGCSPQLRHALARALEKSHPREALSLHQIEIGELIEKKRRQEYRAAAALLERVRRLYADDHADDEWSFYISSLLATHKAKTSFVAMLRDGGLDPSS